MSSLSFSPAISKIEYLVDNNPIDGVIVLDENKKSVSIRITLSGLNLMYSPEEFHFTKTKSYTPIKIFITNFTQRGMKDTVVHDVKAFDITKEIMEKGNYSVDFHLGDFNKPYFFEDAKDFEFKYNLVENIMYVKFFYAPYIDVLDINTFDEQLKTILEYADHTFKVPMVSFGEGDE